MRAFVDLSIRKKLIVIIPGREDWDAPSTGEHALPARAVCPVEEDCGRFHADECVA